MKLFATLVSSLLLVAAVSAQNPNVQSFDDIGLFSAGSVDQLDLSGAQTPTTGGGSGGNHGGYSHGHHRGHTGHHHRGRHGRCRSSCYWPSVRGIDVCALPVVTDECFTISGNCLDLIDAVYFGCDRLDEDGTIGEGSWEVSSDGTQLEVCPPQCLPAGCYSISLYRNGCRVARFGVRLFEPTVPMIACDDTLRVGQTQCIYVHDGGRARPNRIYVLISPDNTPSVIPGLVELGLGNNFTNYICGVSLQGPCAVDCIGVIPPSLAGNTLYFQAVIFNPSGNFLPLPVTGVCATNYVQ